MARSDEKNSALAVGYKSDRSFVVRGDKIGVFKHTQDDGLGILSLFSRLSLILCARVFDFNQSRQYSQRGAICTIEGMFLSFYSLIHSGYAPPPGCLARLTESR